MLRLVVKHEWAEQLDNEEIILANERYGRLFAEKVDVRKLGGMGLCFWGADVYTTEKAQYMVPVAASVTLASPNQVSVMGYYDRPASDGLGFGHDLNPEASEQLHDFFSSIEPQYFGPAKGAGRLMLPLAGVEVLDAIPANVV